MRVRSILAVSVVALFVVMMYWIANPTHLNKLVLVRANPTNVLNPRSVELVGKVSWRQEFSAGGSIGPKKGPIVLVADVHHAWFEGSILLKDDRGSTIASVPVQPHGRYGGALVVFVDNEGNSYSAWNSLPEQLFKPE